MDQLDANMDQGKVPEEQVESMEMLLAQEGMGLDIPKRGEIRTGVIASINNGQILVSIGTKSEGIISSREYEQISDDEKDLFAVGQEISVYVINPEDQHGNLVLSYLRAREATDWDEVESLRESKDAYNSTIIGYNKGGLLVKVGGLSGFVPASQLGLTRRARIKGETPDKRWGAMVGEKIEVRVIEVDRNRRRLILSERAASNETRESLKERVIEDLEVGQVYKGRVTSLASFGAFVNVNGADGLVHLSEIAWERIQDPSEILEIGQEVNVKVISIQKEKKRIGLSIRQLLPDPWIDKSQQYEVGQMVQCKITRLTSFGAFAEIEPGLEGLIHISELADHRVEHPKEVLHEGEEVNLRVIKIEPEEHRIGLSLRRVESMKYADMDWNDLLDDSDDDSDDDADANTDASAEEETVVEEAVAEEAVAEEAVVEDVVEEAVAEDVAEVEAEETAETEDSSEEDAD